MHTPLILPLATAGGFVAIVLACYGAAMHVEERAASRAIVGRIEAAIGTPREEELRRSFLDRTASTAGVAVTQLARRLTPVGRVQSIQRQLVLAGRPGQADLERYLVVRGSMAALVPVVAVAVFAGLAKLSPLMKVSLTGFAAALLILGPDAKLKRQVQERQQRIRVSLPDILDLLTISVEAGLGFEQAVDRTVTSVPGPLSDEFSRMLAEVRAGVRRADALAGVDKRTEVAELRSFLLAIAQADAFGVSISAILRSQSEEIRMKRRQQAQEQAQKAPVKMLFPMIFCIFPSLFVVVLGPAAINMHDKLFH